MKRLDNHSPNYRARKQQIEILNSDRSEIVLISDKLEIDKIEETIAQN